MITFCWVLTPLVFGYTFDTDCFDLILEESNNWKNTKHDNPTNNPPDDNSSNHQKGNPKNRLYPEDVLVTVTHLHMNQYNSGPVVTTIKSERKKIITTNIPTTLTYNYPASGSGYVNFNPRNLTLYFDGESVLASIGHLVDSYNGLSGNPPTTQEWLQCQTGSYLTFHEYDSLSSTGRKSHTWEKLEVKAAPPNTPYGPSYDDDCSIIGGIPNVSSQLERNTKGVASIEHIYRVKTRQGTFDSVLSEFKVDVERNSPVVVHLNHTVAESGYGFVGAAANPRNITFWLNESNSLVVAVAYLDQRHSFVVDHDEDTETWICPAGLDEDGEVPFCSFTSSSTSGVFSMRADVLKISLLELDHNGAAMTNYVSAAIVAVSVILSFLL